MRKTIAFLLLALLAAPVMAETTTSGGLIEMRLLKHEPSPAEPGAYADVWATIANPRGGATATNLECRVEDRAPFSVDSEENREKDLGNLPPGYESNVKWRIRVDEDAVPGNNLLDITCQHDNYPSLTLEADVYVQPTEAVLSIDRAEVPVMVPGQQANLNIKLKNLAAISVKEVSVKLDFDELSFAPVGSTGEKQLSIISGRGEETVSFTLITYPDAQPGVYKIPVTLSYYDRLGKEYEKEDVLGVIVDAETDLHVNVEESDLYKSASSGRVSLEIVNRGLEDVKFLSVKVLAGEGYEVTGASEVYVGELSSDDYSGVDFRVYAEAGASQQMPFKLELSYTDAFNQQKIEEVTVNVPLYSDEELARLGITPVAGMDMVTVAIAAIILVYAAYWLYKRFKKK